MSRLLGTLMLALLLPLPARAADLSATKRFTAEPDIAGRYVLSLPYEGGLDDIANSSLDDPCDLSSSIPDGELNADDLICKIWGEGELDARHGAITVMDIPRHCTVLARTAIRPRTGEPPIFVGGPFVIRTQAGVLVTLSAIGDQPLPDYTVTFSGPCEARLPPQLISSPCTMQFLAVPYDSRWDSADAVLCGVEGEDWEYDGSSLPNRCPGGIYRPEDGVSKGIVTYLNPWDPDSGGAWGLVGRTVFEAGGTRWVGRSWDVEPGDGLIWMGAEQLWEPPVEDCP